MHKTLKYSIIKDILKESNSITEDDYFASVTHYLQSKSTLEGRLYKRQIRVEDLKKLSPINVRWDVPFPPPKNPKFTFIDIFAGIGGFRIAFQKLGGKCVFSSEIDKYAKKTYEANFGEMPFGDITKIKEAQIPKHNVLLAFLLAL